VLSAISMQRLVNFLTNWMGSSYKVDPSVKTRIYLV